MSAIESRSLSLSMRCYRVLLRAYPQAFLLDFEDLLCQAFGDLAHRAVRTKGSWGLLLLWVRTVPDLISSALSQRFRTTAEWSFRLRWIVACSGGVLLPVLCIFGPAYLIHHIQRWFGLLPPNTLNLVPVVPRSQPEWLYNFRIFRDTALLGLVLGLFQSLALGWKSSRRVAWTLATTLGVMSAVCLILLVPFVAAYLRVSIHPWRLFLDHHPTMYYGGSAALCISIMGILQTFVLARRNPRALAWVPASAIGVLACSVITVVVGNPVLRRLHGSLSAYAILGLIVGTAYGLLTVLPLEWILRPRMEQDEVPIGSSDLHS